jgi:glycosyltransferase involved in cell wall biosynthesis
MAADGRRSAIVHDWFFQPGGAESAALELARLLPAADVYTSFADRATTEELGDRLHPWPLQRLVGATRRFRSFLPLYPLWFGTLRLSDADLVVSSSSAFAKAVRTRPGALHVGYIYTPMRYAWDLEGYLATSSFSLPTRLAARTLRPLLRRWDVRTARRPDVLVAISHAVRSRIERSWGRDADVIYPPVQVDALRVSSRDDGYLLIAARMLAYRRIDLAVDAATRTGRDLVLVGGGPEERRLRSRAGPHVRFAGRVDRATLIDLIERCHAYVVPGEEDFGIAPVEAMAAGKPVVAFGGGGALETVVDGVSGVFFDRSAPDALAEAIERVDSMAFDPKVIRANAERFDVTVFRQRWRELFARLGVDPALYAA